MQNRWFLAQVNLLPDLPIIASFVLGTFESLVVLTTLTINSKSKKTH